MAVKKSRLAEIYKAEKARGGGVASTLGKRALEKFDPRQFFNQDSFLAAVLPSLFKAYKVDTKTTSPKSITPSLMPTNVGSVEVVNELNVIKTDMKINAKNSMVLPAIARDMNLMRQNIAKLVKVQGEKPAYKADMFFKRASERESEYESKFKKENTGRTTPTTASATTTPTAKSGGFMSGLFGGLGKGLGIASIGAGIAGFLAAIGGAGFVLNQIGGASGLKDLLVNLAEGLNAFTGQSLVALGSLLGAGMLFGAVTGVSTKVGAALGITAIGVGIGGFMAGLSAGGVASEFIGGSSGVKDMLVNLAAGLSAFNSPALIGLGALLGAGALFGVVTGVAAPAGLAMMGGAMLGMTAIGLGVGGFLSALSLGGAGVNLFGGASGVKDMMVALAEGLGAFSGLDAGSLGKLALAIPAFGAGMLAFFGLQGIAGIVKSFSEGIKGAFDWIFGTKTDKTPMQQLASDLQLFSNINGDNLSRVGQGLKDIASGMLGLAQLKPEDMQKIQAAAAIARTVGGTAPAAVPAPAQQNTLQRLNIAPSTVGGGRGTINPPSVSPTPVDSTSNRVLDLIASGEAVSKDPYNSMNQGTPGGRIFGSGVSSSVIGKNLTDMTVGEILDRAPNPNDTAEQRKEKGVVFAAGRYQIIPKTLQGLVESGAVSRNERFTPEVQDRLGMKLIEQSGATKSINEGDLDKAQYQLAKVWASLPVPAGMMLKSGQISTGSESFYGGANKAKEGLTLASLQGVGPSTMTGTTLAAATTETSTARMQMASAAPVIVNAPTTNNVQQGGGQRTAQYTAPSVVDTEFTKMLVARVV